VVVGVIGVLVGLLLPAVQNIREAANRVRCANNLHQLGVALHSYEQRMGRLPPSHDGGQVASWAWMILPDLEQDNLYGRGDPVKAARFELEDNAVLVDVPVYYCPTRARPANAWTGLHSFVITAETCGGRPMPLTPKRLVGTPGDYAASVGTTGSTEPVLLPGGVVSRPNGLFQFASGLPLDRITDGLSNTLMVGEKHIPTEFRGDYPFEGPLWDGHNPAPNTRGAGPDFPLADRRQDPRWCFGSYHPGICQFAFADGSVRRLRNTINPGILGLLAHRSDGQPIPGY
jgi:hypothetical protein